MSHYEAVIPALIAEIEDRIRSLEPNHEKRKRFSIRSRKQKKGSTISEVAAKTRAVEVHPPTPESEVRYSFGNQTHGDTYLMMLQITYPYTDEWQAAAGDDLKKIARLLETNAGSIPAGVELRQIRPQDPWSFDQIEDENQAVLTAHIYASLTLTYA